MKKSELIKAVHTLFPFLTSEQASTAVNLVFSNLMNGLLKAKRAEIRGFGSFALRRRKVQLQFSTQSEVIKLGEKNNVYFRLGKELFDRLNEK